MAVFTGFSCENESDVGIDDREVEKLTEEFKILTENFKKPIEEIKFLTEDLEKLTEEIRFLTEKFLGPGWRLP